MKIAVYPGSFDPFTLGHLDISQRLLQLFDEVHLLVANSEMKNYLFSPEERCSLIRTCLNSSKIKVTVGSGLTVDYVKSLSGAVLVRGIRSIMDVEYEMVMANMNRMMAPEAETLVMFTSPQHAFLSSRFVKEIAKNGGDITNMVPATVAQAVQKKFVE